MSREKREGIKLVEAGLITNEALEAYVNNSLSTTEKQELEKLLAGDPFAQEALEGLQAVGSKRGTTITNINNKVREKSGLREGKRIQLHWTTYAWAAAVFGLIIAIGATLTWYLSNKTDTQQQVAVVQKQNDNDKNVNIVEQKNTVAPIDTTSALKKDTSTPVSQTIATDKNAVADNQNKANTTPAQPATNVPDAKAKDQAAVAGTKQPVTPNPALTTNSSVTASNQWMGAPTTNNQQAALKKTEEKERARKGADDKAAQNDLSEKPTPAMNEVTMNETAERKDAGKESSTSLEEAMKSFSSTDYNKAAEQFDKILKHDPDNSDALYFGGISDYINGKTAKSEKNFDKLLKKGTKFTEGSKWYKANILLKKGENDKAKSILQELANSNGSYKERAVKKLSEMGF